MAVYLTLVATIVQLARRQEFWGRRGRSVEVAAALICREAGARVRTNVLVRDMDQGGPVHDSRRLEISALQLAIDTTLASTLHCDGSARRGAAQIEGAVFAEARRVR